MAGLFGYMAAGAGQGLGNSIVEQGKAKRDAQLRLLEMEQRYGYERSLLEERNKFTAAENEKDRASRGDLAKQAAEMGGELVQMEDGSSGVRIGSQIRPLTDTEGNRRNVVVGGKNDNPADVKAAEWLIQQGVAKDSKEAWELVRSGRTPPVSLADVEKMAQDATELEFEGSFKRDPAKVQQTFERHRQRLMGTFGLKDTQNSGPGAQVMHRPAGMTDEQIVKQAQDAVARGADKAAVSSRLRQMGIDPKEAGL